MKLDRIFSKALCLYLSLAFLIFFFIRFSGDLRDNRGQETLFIYDVNNYYSYLPAIFIHKDLTFSYPNNYWTNPAPDGTKIAKGTYGMALMYSPWFFIAHQVALSQQDEVTGYEKTYDFLINFGSFTYAVLAAFFLIKSLFYFTKPWLAALTYFGIFFGTNLYYYTVSQGAMPHSYLFLLFSLMIYLTLLWHKNPKPLYLSGLGLTLGLIILIRPTDLIVVLIPLLYGVNSKNSFVEKIKLLTKNIGPLCIAAVLFLLPFFVQMIYWKVYTDSWLFFSYGSKERFFFSDPKIWQVLFSFRKGLFVYTPIALLFMAGFFVKSAHKKQWIWPVSSLFLTTIFVVSSWWDWWFGGSFGHRAFVQYYAFLALPFSAFLQWAFRSFWRAIPVLIFCGFCIHLNLLQSAQYRHSIIHYDSMSKEAYFYAFGKTQLTKEEYEELTQLLERPNYEKAINGKR